MPFKFYHFILNPYWKFNGTVPLRFEFFGLGVVVMVAVFRYRTIVSKIRLFIVATSNSVQCHYQNGTTKRQGSQ